MRSVVISLYQRISSIIEGAKVSILLIIRFLYRRVFPAQWKLWGLGQSRISKSRGQSRVLGLSLGIIRAKVLILGPQSHAIIHSSLSIEIKGFSLFIFAATTSWSSLRVTLISKKLIDALMIAVYLALSFAWEGTFEAIAWSSCS